MDERDQASVSGGHELASEVGDRVRTIISAAEAAANAVRHEAEQAAAVRRRVAEEEARRIIEDAKADADAYLAERMRRISELSDTVVERAETIVARLDRAEEVRRQLQELADALGESAERLASEVRVGAPPPSVQPPRSGFETGAGEPPAQPVVNEPPPPAGTAPARPAPAAPDAEPPIAPEADRFAQPEADRFAQPEAETFAEPEVDRLPEPEPPVAEPPPATPPEAPSDIVRLERREPPPAEPRAPVTRRDADDQLGARLVALQMAVAGGARGEVEAHLRRTFVELGDPASILDDVFGQGTDSDKRVAWPHTGDATA